MGSRIEIVLLIVMAVNLGLTIINMRKHKEKGVYDQKTESKNTEFEEIKRIEGPVEEAEIEVDLQMESVMEETEMPESDVEAETMPEPENIVAVNMSCAEVMEQMDNILESIKFYKGADGKYYVTATLPELPDGFINMFHVSIIFKDDVKVPLFYISTKPRSKIEEGKIPNIGQFTKEITGMTSVEDVKNVSVNFEIQNPEKDAYARYAFEERERFILITYYGYQESTGRYFDPSKVFVWKSEDKWLLEQNKCLSDGKEKMEK